METDNSPTKFHFSKVFNAHKSDVRDVIATNPNTILSCSRDGNIKLWTERAGVFKDTFDIQQQRNISLSALAFYKSINGSWMIFAGVRDGTIEVFNSGNSKPSVVLRNHTENVCVLYLDTERRLLLSGSWDSRVVVWSLDKIMSGVLETGAEIVHHKNSVWGVLTMPGDVLLYVTSSADRTIKVHNENFQELYTFTGHSDVVRTLIALSPTQFLSSSNDGTIRKWSLTDKKCLQLHNTGAREFIYRIQKVHHKNGKTYIVVCMEKGYVEILEIVDNELFLVQNLRLPVGSVWSAVGYRNTDIVFGTTGGTIYVYSTDPSRKADEEGVQALNSELASYIAAEEMLNESQENDIVTIKIALDDGAPNMTLNYKKGDDPRVTAESFIKEHNLPISYYSEIVEFIKANIPEARAVAEGTYTQPQTPSRKYKGVRYDYVFDVRLSQEGTPLGLCYNIGEDPADAATRFLADHDLPETFHDQIVAYLNSEVPELTEANRTGFVRIGGQEVLNRARSSSTYTDPYTGSGRYIPGSGKDDFHLASSSKSDKTRPRGSLVPIRDAFTFPPQSMSEKMIPKLEEMNELMDKDKQLSPEQIEAIKQFVSNTAKPMTDELLLSAIRMGLTWSMESLLPVLDVFRIAVLDSNLHEIFCSKDQLGHQTYDRLMALLISDPPDNVRTILCRVFTNISSRDAGIRLLMADIGEVFRVVAQQLSNPKQTVQWAAASVLANCARFMLAESEEGRIKELGPREDGIRAIISVAESLDSFSGASSLGMTRLLQTIATLMWGDASVIRLAKNRKLEIIINRIKDAITEENVKALCRDIVEMIRAV